MNSKKLSKKLDKLSDKVCKYLSFEGKHIVTYDQTRISIRFVRSADDGKWGHGTIGLWVVEVGSESKEFTGKTLNSAFRSCLRHYKEEYQKNVVVDSN